MKRHKLMTVIVALSFLSAGCSKVSDDTTKSVDCAGKSLAVAGETICVATKALQETGFKCPAALPNVALYGELKICSKAVQVPLGTSEVLSKNYPKTALNETCKALPTCGSDSEIATLTACKTKSGCYETTLCGRTVYCASPSGTCAAEPVCNTNEKSFNVLAECSKTHQCRAVTMCETTIYCGEIAAQCGATPSCKNDEKMFNDKNECEKNGKCRSETLCGTTIYCIGVTSSCSATPTCQDGETEVKDSSMCLQDDAVCYKAAVCDQTIWCTGPSAPMCPEKSVAIHGDDCVVDDNSCYMLSESVWCDKNRTIISGHKCMLTQGTCTKDADCSAQGCSSEICAPKDLGLSSDCVECSKPENSACGCIAGQCAWFNRL